MIQFSYVPYKLSPASGTNAKSTGADRDGALLKVEWANGRIGYSDLHPWPELGDDDIQQQLDRLRAGKLSSILEQAIWLAQRDAVARQEKKSLLDGQPVLRNNYLINDLLNFDVDRVEDIKDRGFEILKIKVGRDFAEEAKIVNRIANVGKFMIRLDFNSMATWQIYEKFMTSLDKRATAYIEYVEDPMTYDHQTWKECRRLAKIAIDFQIKKHIWNDRDEPPFDVIILKPARQDVDNIMKWAQKWRRKVTVTSNMDHPVGNIHAYSVAQELSQKHALVMNEPGCQTIDSYQRTAYAQNVQMQGPYIRKVPQTGIGFDALLSKESWQPLQRR